MNHDTEALKALVAFIKADKRINGDVALTECRKALPALERLLAGQQEPRASFWVIEKFIDGRSIGYWDGGHSEHFVTDIEKAIQFRRKDDAFWFNRAWGPAQRKDVQLTEHLMFSAAPPVQEAGWPPKDSVSVQPASLGAEDLLNLIPSNWCDPLLTGPDSALGLSKAPWGCPEIEALLNGLRERIRKHLQHQPIKDEK